MIFSNIKLPSIILVHKRIALAVAGVVVVVFGVSAYAMYRATTHHQPTAGGGSEQREVGKRTNGSKPSNDEMKTTSPRASDGKKTSSDDKQSNNGSHKQAASSSGKPTSTAGAGGSNSGSGGSAPMPTAPAATRDPLKQPFASTSIWNMPIGSGAQYVPANLPANPGSDNWTPMPQIDDEQIVLKPTAPLTNIMYSNVGWSGGNRCNATGGLLLSVPIPSNFLVANSRDNNGAAFLLSDGRTIAQTQPFTRCTAGGVATSIIKFPNVDLYGDGISGAHGGSRMSSIGGSIRIGELRPGQQGMKHAIKLNVDAPQALYRCTKESDCFRWPALTSDSGSVGDYGSQTNNQNTAMKMGALLAIQPTVNINAIGLESVPGKQMAWTLQNYGAYIVDSTGGPAYAFSAENGPDGSMRSQFQSDYGYPFEQRINDNTSWSRDIQRLIQLLHVVNNNGPNSIGGGGTPRQPLAPAI